MFITRESLKKAGACGQGYRWFCKTFPNGVELMDLIKHPSTESHHLNWGIKYFTPNEEEYLAYIQKVKYTNCGDFVKTIVDSENVDNSKYIITSKNINGSSYIIKSEDVNYSDNVLESKNISNSNNIYNSNFCFNSTNVINSNNVTASEYICNTTYSHNSHYILGGQTIIDSDYCLKYFSALQNLENCSFVVDSNNLKNCLFCSNLSDKEAYLFNKPIAPAQLILIRQQLKTLVEKEVKVKLIEDEKWPEGSLCLETPKINFDLKNIFNFSDTFIRWIKTLPGYSNEIFFNIALKNL